MAAVHHDKSFSHPLHIVLIFLTLGLWFPVWLARWQMHKTDRVREAIADLDRQLEIGLLKSQRREQEPLIEDTRPPVVD